MDVKVIFIFLIGICSTRAFYSLIPDGTELIYEYEGTISASTHLPRPYASSFTLRGNLHLQRDNQSVFAKFSDLQYKIFNGLDDDYDSKILPVPEQMEDFSKAFRIEYQPSGNIAGIATGKDEKQYAVNYKKGISSIFQLDLEMMKDYDNQDVFVFQTVENTVYGKGKVDYLVNVSKDAYYIDVMQEPHSTHHMYTHLLSNVEYKPPRFDFDEPLNRYGQRSYVLTKIGDYKIVDNMKHSGGVYNTPFNGQGEAHVIHMNQSLVLKSKKPIISKIDVESEIYYNDLIYYVGDLNPVDLNFPDITNGRRTFRKEAMIDQAIALIKELVDFVAESKIDDSRPDFKKGQIVNRLSGVMLVFDEEMFDEMYAKLSKSVDLEKHAHFAIYYRMMTALGTHAAYRHILKLHKENKIHRFQYNMFANVKFPNKKLVDDMAQILKWDSMDYNPTFYGAAILSFGTLLNKAVERNKRYANSDLYPGKNLEEEYPDHEYYEKYVVELVNKLKATQKYDQQILYLQTLHNTRMESIVEHLVPAIKGKWWKDPQLRILAALAIYPVVAESEESTFKAYWPFLINSRTPTSLRITCYYMIMKSQPTLARLTNIYWVMESMKNDELYRFHYKYITALSQSESPHNRKFIVHLKQILKYTSKPVFRGFTGYHHLDYFNEDYSLGEELDLATIHSELENDIVLFGSYENSVNRMREKPYWVFLRISGFNPSFLKALKLDTTSKTFLFTWETLVNVVKNLGKSDNVAVTFILTTNGHTITTKTFDKYNVMGFISELELLKTTDKINDGGFDVNYELSKTIILPTDMGFPAISFNDVPEIDHTYVSISSENNDDEIKLSFDVVFKSLTNTRRGLSFYNPFLDVFQGVSKLHSLDRKLNFRFNASIDTAQHTLKVSWKKSETPNEDFFAERSYTDTAVYVLDDFKTGVLQKSSLNCNNFEFVTLGEEYKFNHTVKILPLLDFVTQFHEFALDLEEPLPKELDSELDLDSGKFKEFLKQLMYSRQFEELQPKDMNYGIIKTIQVKDFFPVDNIAMILKLDTEYKKGNNYLYPAVTYNMKFHYIAGTDNETFTSWTAKAELDMDDGHVNNIFSAHVSRFFKNDEITLCLKGESTWSTSTDPDFKSTVYISSNVLQGEMCAKNNSLVKIQMHVEKSEEQKESVCTYNTCHENVKGPIEKQKSLDCLLEYDSLRKYTINLEHSFTEDEKNRYLRILREGVLKQFSHTSFVGRIDGIKGNELRTIFYLPMRPAAALKFYVYTEDSGNTYAVANKLDFRGVNAIFGSMFEFLHEYGLTEVCIINQKGKLTNIIGKEEEYAVSSAWSLLLGTIKTEPKFEIWMKSADGNKMALKFVFKTHTLVVEPKDKRYIFTVDGQEMDAEKTSFTNNWLHYAWVTDTKIVSIYVNNIGSHVIYNGHQASIEYAQIENVDMQGRCLDRV